MLGIRGDTQWNSKCAGSAAPSKDIIYTTVGNQKACRSLSYGVEFLLKLTRLTLLEN